MFPGSVRGFQGKLRENSGKIAGIFFPNREMLQMLGFRAPGKANLPGTLGRHCLDLDHTFRAGIFFGIDGSTLLEFFSDLPSTTKLLRKSFPESYFS